MASMKNKSLEEIERKIIPILRHNDVVRASLFGSFVRGEAKKSSDIDILIKFKGRKSLLDLVGLKLELEERLKRKVDVVEYSVVHPLIKNRVLKEQVRIL